MVTLPKISPNIAANAVPSLPCGLNLDLSILKNALGEFQNLLGDMTSGLAGFADNISELASTLTAQLDALKSQLLDALGDIPVPDFTLLDKISELCAALAAGLDPSSIIRSIQANFPDFDLQAILDKLALGTFDPCTDIPNMISTDGVVTTIPSPVLQPTEDATPPATPVPDVIPTRPAGPYRLGIITEADWDTMRAKTNESDIISFLSELVERIRYQSLIIAKDTTDTRTNAEFQDHLKAEFRMAIVMKNYASNRLTDPDAEYPEDIPANERPAWTA